MYSTHCMCISITQASFRHSSASLWKKSDEKQVTTTLDIYTHNLKKDDREAADVMGSIIDQNPDEKEDDEDDDQEPGLVMGSF